MGEGVHADVTEAYRFLVGLRLRAQLRMLSEHRPVTSEITVAELTAARAEPAQGLVPRDPAVAGEGGVPLPDGRAVTGAARRAGPA